MARRYYIKEGITALGASQIMIALFHIAFGIFWIFLFYLEEKSNSVGFTAMLVLIIYSFSSSIFFILSGSATVFHKASIKIYQIILATVLNLLSVLVTIFGLVILGIAFAIFESHGTIYTWSNMAGMMLIHYLLLSTIAELILTTVVLHWMERALHHEAVSEELGLETVMESSQPSEDSSERV